MFSRTNNNPRLKNVALSHLADPKVFDFAHLETLRNSAICQPDSEDGLDILSI